MIWGFGNEETRNKACTGDDSEMLKEKFGRKVDEEWPLIPPPRNKYAPVSVPGKAPPPIRVHDIDGLGEVLEHHYGMIIDAFDRVIGQARTEHPDTKNLPGRYGRALVDELTKKIAPKFFKALKHMQNAEGIPAHWNPKELLGRTFFAAMTDYEEVHPDTPTLVDKQLIMKAINKLPVYRGL